MTDADRGWMSVGRCPTWLAGHIGVSSHTVQKKSSPTTTSWSWKGFHVAWHKHKALSKLSHSAPKGSKCVSKGKVKCSCNGWSMSWWLCLPCT